MLAAWVVGVPLTLLHELSHALTAIALGARRVTVFVGREPVRSATLGRLELRVRFLNRPRWTWFGIVEWQDELSRARMSAVITAGPLVSALVLTSLIVAAAFVPWPPVLLVWVIATTVAWEVLVTAVPMRYPRWFGPYAGLTSDGYRIVRLLRAS